MLYVTVGFAAVLVAGEPPSKVHDDIVLHPSVVLVNCMLLPSNTATGFAVNVGSGHKLTSKRWQAIFWVVTFNVFET